MVWTEKGPLDIFIRLRALLARSQKRSGGVYDAVSCFYCLSVWTAMIPALALASDPWNFIGYTLIFSAIAIFLNQLFDKLSNV